MLKKVLLPIFATLSFVVRITASPQVTTALRFGVSDPDDTGDADITGDDEIISGVIVGSGADGTTYVLSVGATGTDDTPLTVTLVENSSAASAIVEIHGDTDDEGESVTETEVVQCSFSGDSAVCEQQLVLDATSTTFSTAFTTSGAAESIIVAVSTTSASGDPSSSGSVPPSSAAGASQSSSAGRLPISRMNAAGVLFSLLFGFVIVM